MADGKDVILLISSNDSFAHSPKKCLVIIIRGSLMLCTSSRSPIGAEAVTDKIEAIPLRAETLTLCVL